LRVVTRRLDTTGNYGTFLKSVDSDIASILIAKKAILKARKTTNNEEIIKDLYPYDIFFSHCMTFLNQKPTEIPRSRKSS
jgi:hypothetical protein